MEFNLTIIYQSSSSSGAGPHMSYISNCLSTMSYSYYDELESANFRKKTVSSLAEVRCTPDTARS